MRTVYCRYFYSVSGSDLGFDSNLGSNHSSIDNNSVPTNSIHMLQISLFILNWVEVQDSNSKSS